MEKNRALTGLSVAALAALTQGLLLWLILGDVQALFDAFVLAFAALSLATSAEAMREATGSRLSYRVGLAFGLVLVGFGAVTACVGKAESSSNPEAWNAAAFVVGDMAMLTAWGTRRFVEVGT
jgi:ABC-type hemin transport system substrate-binding protein